MKWGGQSKEEQGKSIFEKLRFPDTFPYSMPLNDCPSSSGLGDTKPVRSTFEDMGTRQFTGRLAATYTSNAAEPSLTGLLPPRNACVQIVLPGQEFGKSSPRISLVTKEIPKDTLIWGYPTNDTTGLPDCDASSTQASPPNLELPVSFVVYQS